MKHKNYGGWICLIIFLTLAILGIITHPTGSWRIILFITELLVLIVLIEGIYITPNQPPHIGIVTRFDKREWKKAGIGPDGEIKYLIVYVTEGWSWFFLRRIFYKIILINNSKREIDFDEQILTTPDGVTTKVPGSLAYTLDPKNIINFLNLGGDNPFKVFEDMMNDVFEDKLRVWSRNPLDANTPQTWEDLLNSGPLAEKMIVQSLCGNNVIITDIDVAKISAGHGKWPINHFGIFLNRMNLKEMVPFGKIYEDSLKLKTEQKEREAETYEVKTDVLRASELQKQLSILQKNLSIDECLKLVMQWKIQREANQLLTIGAFAKNIAQAWKGGTTS